jgi:hypothetical protein
MAHGSREDRNGEFKARQYNIKSLDEDGKIE